MPPLPNKGAKQTAQTAVRAPKRLGLATLAGAPSNAVYAGKNKAVSDKAASRKSRTRPAKANGSAK